MAIGKGLPWRAYFTARSGGMLFAEAHPFHNIGFPNLNWWPKSDHSTTRHRMTRLDRPASAALRDRREWQVGGCIVAIVVEGIQRFAFDCHDEGNFGSAVPRLISHEARFADKAPLAD